jgi:hypothetical protein
VSLLWNLGIIVLLASSFDLEVKNDMCRAAEIPYFIASTVCCLHVHLFTCFEAWIKENPSLDHTQ